MDDTSTHRNIINNGKTAEHHKQIIPSLLAGHAPTGCYSVPKLFGIGKIEVCSLLRNYPFT